MGPGRPRHSAVLRSGDSGRAQILDAAGELFTRRGYVATTTRAIAEAVGIRQASLYHHFRTKEDILEALLASTVVPVLPVAAALRDLPAGPADRAAARLYALALHDTRQLYASRWNLGALYLLPELRAERFDPFRENRLLLREHYSALTADVVARTGGPEHATVLVFGLVESLTNLRADGSATEESPHWIADGCVRLTHWSGEPRQLAQEAEAILRDVVADLAPPAGS